MGAWRDVARIGTARMMHRGQTRGVREGRGEEVSGREKRAKEMLSGLVAVVWQSKASKGLTPQSSVVSQASPSFLGLGARALNTEL